MCSISKETSEEEEEGTGYRDDNKCDAAAAAAAKAEEDYFDCDEMGSDDETEIFSPALNSNHYHNASITNTMEPRPRRSKIMVVMACILFAACLALVVGFFHTSDGSGLLSNTLIYGDQQDSFQGSVQEEEEEEKGNVIISPTSQTTGKRKIIEFTIANLNTNSNNCTYIQDAHELQCSPNHDMSTNKIRIILLPEWAPIGVERFESLTASNFWQDVRIFRVVPNFVVQFGINSDPEVQESWSSLGPIQDDPVMASNVRGSVTFATSGPNSRTTQIFINTNDNTFLDGE